MASQFFSVKGRRPKYNYVDAINAQTPYLPQKYLLNRESEMQDREFKANQKYLNKNLALQEDQFEQEKSDTKLANLLGIGKLGTDVYFASKASEPTGKAALSGALPGSTKAATKAAISNPALRSNMKEPGLMDKAVDWLKPNQSISNLFDSSLADWKTGLTPGNILTGAGGGIVANAIAPGKKKKPWQSALWGAGGGAVSSFVGSGGDLYKTAIGALSGSGAGAIGQALDFF